MEDLLEERLRRRVQESGVKKSYWIEKEEIYEGRNREIFQFHACNQDQGDGTFKTAVFFEGCLFQYVGEPLETR